MVNGKLFRLGELVDIWRDDWTTAWFFNEDDTHALFLSVQTKTPLVIVKIDYKSRRQEGRLVPFYVPKNKYEEMFNV